MLKTFELIKIPAPAAIKAGNPAFEFLGCSHGRLLE